VYRSPSGGARSVYLVTAARVFGRVERALPRIEKSLVRDDGKIEATHELEGEAWSREHEILVGLPQIPKRLRFCRGERGCSIDHRLKHSWIGFIRHRIHSFKRSKKSYLRRHR
jgi:hypothetical protein